MSHYYIIAYLFITSTIDSQVPRVIKRPLFSSKRGGKSHVEYDDWENASSLPLENARSYSIYYYSASNASLSLFRDVVLCFSQD
jgi:hypothetical protein